MARSRLSITLEGFDEMIEQIRKAEGNVDSAIQTAVNAGASAAESALRSQCAASGVPDSVTGAITRTVERTGNRYTVGVGWELGAYNPQNISQGYKAVFLNYGTPHRTKHGQTKARGFIAKAKKASLKPVKAAQQSALEKIMKELEQ